MVNNPPYPQRKKELPSAYLVHFGDHSGFGHVPLYSCQLTQHTLIQSLKRRVALDPDSLCEQAWFPIQNLQLHWYQSKRLKGRGIY